MNAEGGAALGRPGECASGDESTWGMDENRIGGESTLPPVYGADELAALSRGDLEAHCARLQDLCVQLAGDCKFLSWEVRESGENMLRLARVAQIAHHLNAADLDTVADLAVNDIPQYLNCRFAAFFLYDQAAADFTLHRSSHPVRPVDPARARFPAELFFCGAEPFLVARTDDGYETKAGDGAAPPVVRPDSAWLERLGKTAVVLPLVVAQPDAPPVRLGGLLIGDNDGSLCERDVEVFQMFGDLLSSSLYNARLVQQLSTIATTDALTRLYNRRYFFDALDKAIAQADRNGYALSLVVLDIDFFKRFNDAHGHHCGDLVLMEMGSILDASLRKNVDVAARYGGEEFAIILLHTRIDQALRVAERIRRVIARKTVLFRGSELLVTCSFGIAEYIGGESAAQLVERADASLYQAKESGRNRVCAIAAGGGEAKAFLE